MSLYHAKSLLKSFQKEYLQKPRSRRTPWSEGWFDILLTQGGKYRKGVFKVFPSIWDDGGEPPLVWDTDDYPWVVAVKLSWQHGAGFHDAYIYPRDEDDSRTVDQYGSKKMAESEARKFANDLRKALAMGPLTRLFSDVVTTSNVRMRYRVANAMVKVLKG